MSGDPLKLVSTGVPNLDSILGGGIPLYSVNIIAGTSGSGKTILTQQMMFHNCRKQGDDDVHGIFFTTLSEPAFKMIRYQQQFAYFDPDRLNETLFYVDIGQVLRERGLDEALSVISQHVEEREARFIAIDSFKAIHDLAGSRPEVRRFGYDLAVGLAAWTCTSFLVGEYTEEEILSEPIFAVADGIVYLTNPKQGMQNMRRINISKMRGLDYFTGDHPFIISETGITVYPRIRTPGQFEEYPIARERASTGLPSLDEMLDGGLPGGTATMVAGGAGTGKTLLGLHFITSGAEGGEPGVIVTFQENPTQLREIARSFGWDLRALEEQDRLVHLYHSPVEIQPDIHTALVKEAVQRVGARRVLVDSLKDLEITTQDKVRYKDYVYSLVNEFKRQGVTTLLTNEIPELFGSFSLSEFGVSFIADNVILLRYVEMGGRMGRALSVLKVRGSQHDKEIREFEVTGQGLRIGEPIRAMTGVLTGTPVIGGESGWRELRPVERYLMEVLQPSSPATLAEMADATMILPEALEPLLGELAERGYLLAYGKGDGRKYKAAV